MIRFDDGSAETKLTVKKESGKKEEQKDSDKKQKNKEQKSKQKKGKDAKTGDENQAGVWIALIVAASALIAAVVAFRVKRRKNP